jgi:hypothetical protein
MRTVEVVFARADDGSLGLEIEGDDENRAVIAGIVDGTPAASVTNGPCVGDRIVGIDGTPVSSVHEVLSELRRQATTGLTEVVRLALHRPLSQPEPVVWSAGAITIGPGDVLAVPLVISEASLCKYSFQCAAGGSAMFSVSASGSEGYLVPPREVETDAGQFRIEAPCVLTAHLDNTASMVTAVQVACRVSAMPLSQLVAAEAEKARAELRAQHSHLRALAAQQQGLQAQEAELLSALSAVRSAMRAAAEVSLTDARRSDELEDALHVLRSPPSADEIGAKAAFKAIEDGIALSAQLRQVCAATASSHERPRPPPSALPPFPTPPFTRHTSFSTPNPSAGLSRRPCERHRADGGVLGGRGDGDGGRRRRRERRGPCRCSGKGRRLPAASTGDGGEGRVPGNDGWAEPRPPARGAPAHPPQPCCPSSIVR